MPQLWWFISVIVLDWILTAFIAILFWRIHHVYVVCGGGRPTYGMRWVLDLFLYGIDVRTIDVFGVTVKHVG